MVLTSGDSVNSIHADGSVHWRNTLNDSLVGSVAGSVDGDSKPEVVVVSEDGSVYCLKANGVQLWLKDLSATVSVLPSIYDLDGDGALEIIVGTQDGWVHALNGDGSPAWKFDAGGPVTQPITIFDSDLDANPEVLITTSNEILVVEHNGALAEKHPINSPTGMAIGGSGTRYDLRIGGLGSNVSSFHLYPSFSFNWGTTLQAEALPPITMDLQSDGSDETIVADALGGVTVLKADGEKGWYYGRDVQAVGITAASVPGPSVIATYDDGTILQLDEDGSKIWTVETTPSPSWPAIAVDVDGDTEMELVVVDNEGRLSLVNTHQAITACWPSHGHDLGNTRALASQGPGHLPLSLVWAIDLGQYAPDPTITDLDNDGKKEIVIKNNSEVIVLEHDGRTRGTVPIGPQPYYTGSWPLAADLLGSKAEEYLFSDGHSIKAINGALNIVMNLSFENATAIAAADIDGDDKYEVFVGNNTGHMKAFYASNLTTIWEDDLGFRINYLTVADLGGDGVLDILISTWDRVGNISINHVREATTGSPIWATKAMYYLFSAPVIADINGDGANDLVICDNGTRLEAYLGNGTHAWSRDAPLGPLSIITVIPVDGDGNGLDIGVMSFAPDSQIFIINGENGTILASVPFEVDNHIPEYRMTAAHLGDHAPVALSVPTDKGNLFVDSKGNSFMSTRYGDNPAFFGDLDGDGLIEMVTTVEKTIYAMSLGVGGGPTTPWSMDGHDPGRTYNPFHSAHGVLPDLEVSTPDISFDPPLINDNGTIQVQLKYHNRGATRSEAFNISITSDGTPIKTIRAQPLDAFSEAKVTIPWAVGYQNLSLDVELDADAELDEAQEDNNKASRPLFINLPPTVDAGPDRRVNPGEKVTFDASPSQDRDGTIISYSWDFGDGTSNGSVVTAHTFDKSGYYLVWLNVTDNMGLEASDNATIHVNYAPSIMDWNPRSDPNINEGEEIEFWALAMDPDGDALTLEWALNDIKVGEGSSWTWWANYSSAGDHKVTASTSDGNLTTNRTWTLRVTESQRLIKATAPASPVTMSVSQTQMFSVELHPGAQGALVNWYMDGEKVQTGRDTFGLMAGEGTQGTYAIKVEVIGETGRDFHEWVVTIGPKVELPRIRWAYPEDSDLFTEYGRPIWFGLSAENGDIQWSVDGVAVIGQNGPSFRFDTFEGENHTVTVKVSSHSTYVSQSWNVTAHHPPVAVIKASHQTVAKGRNIEFDGTGSRARSTGATIAGLSWDLGDGERATGGLVNHRYTKSGTYTVRLNVTDSNGMTTEATVMVLVKAKVEPTPGFEASMLLLAAAMACIALRGTRGRRRP